MSLKEDLEEASKEAVEETDDKLKHEMVEIVKEINEDDSKIFETEAKSK